MLSGGMLRVIDGSDMPVGPRWGGLVVVGLFLFGSGFGSLFSRGKGGSEGIGGIGGSLMPVGSGIFVVGIGGMVMVGLVMLM